MPTPDAYQALLQIAFNAARSVADRYRAQITADPNVIDVRAGYKFQGGWITDLPAVVVTVLRKGDPRSLGSEPLPTELDGIPVDVAAAKSYRAVAVPDTHRSRNSAVRPPPHRLRRNCWNLVMYY